MNKKLSQPGLAGLLAALDFAARAHRGQTRKKGGGPFINHPIGVAEILARVGEVTDLILLQAAFLHDILEDTPVSAAQLEASFGGAVLSLVREVTDDMKLPKERRRALQIEGASRLSAGAKQIRVADKICNAMDLSSIQPAGWSLKRKQEYLDWAAQVVDRCRGANLALEREFGRVLAEKRGQLE